MTETASVQKEDTNVDPSLASLSRKCSNCGQTGHNSRTCLEIRETAASEAELKSSAAVSLSTHNTLVSAEQQTDRTSRDEEAEVSDCTADISRETKKKGEPKLASHEGQDQGKLTKSRMSLHWMCIELKF